MLYFVDNYFNEKPDLPIDNTKVDKNLRMFINQFVRKIGNLP